MFILIHVHITNACAHCTVIDANTAGPEQGWSNFSACDKKMSGM